MGINPSHRGGNNDLWISRTPDHGEETQGSQSVSGELGSHRISTSGKGTSTGILSRIASTVRSFFSIFTRSSAGKGGKASTESSIRSRLSVEATGDARATEGAGRGLQKKGYTPGKPVSIPTVPTPTDTDSTGSSSSIPIVEGLKSHLEASAQSRQEQVSKLADQIKSRWTNLENTDEVNYTVTGLQTLVGGLANTRRALTRELQLTRSGANDSTIDEMKTLSQSLWSYAAKDHDQNGESELFSLLVHLSFGGPSLDSSTTIQDYADDLVDLHSEDGFLDEQAQDMLSEFAEKMDSLRSSSLNDANRAWANFINRGEVAVRGVANRELAANVGKYDHADMQENVEWNLSALTSLQQLDPDVFVTTMGVLASDVL